MLKYLQILGHAGQKAGSSPEVWDVFHIVVKGFDQGAPVIQGQTDYLRNI